MHAELHVGQRSEHSYPVGYSELRMSGDDVEKLCVAGTDQTISTRWRNSRARLGAW